MPEGDTIERLAARISSRLLDRQVRECITRDPRLTGLDLAGARLIGVEARGKHLLMRFDTGETLHSHLRMDGSWLIGGRLPSDRWRRRVELAFDDDRLVAVDMPELGVVATVDEGEIVGHLGPDLIDDDQPADHLAERLVSDRETPLAGALLDQTRLAGWGNVFAVELPFIVGVSPFQQVGTVNGLADLVGVGRSLLRYSADVGQRNTTGRRLGTSDHHIYGRVRCPVCGEAVDRLEAEDSPWRRITWWCPSCQPERAQRTVDRQRVRRLLGLHPVRRMAPLAEWPRSSGSSR